MALWSAAKEAAEIHRKKMQDRVDAFRASQGLPPTQGSGNTALSGYADANMTQNPLTPSINSDYGDSRNLLSQYLQTGPGQMPNRFDSGLTDSESRVRALLDNPESIQQSAAYKFRVGQGQEAINRNLAAKGLLGSGNRLMELTKYGQDMASQEYDQQYGRLAGLLGQNMQGYLGDKNANTSQWSAKGNMLSNYYQGAANNALQNQQLTANDRLGWARIKNGESWSPTMSSGTDYSAIRRLGFSG